MIPSDMKFFGFFAVLLLLISCAQKAPNYENLEDVPIVEVSLVYEVAEDEDFFLGQPWSGTADEHGNFYVMDGSAQSIFIFDADGNRVGSIGRQGNGPGEFVRLTKISIDELGKMHAYDSDSRRMSIFEYRDNEWEFVRSFYVQSPPAGFASVIQHLKDDTYFAVFTTFMRSSSEDNVLPPDGVYLFNSEGQITAQPILEVDRMEMIFIQRGDRLMNVVKPYGTRTMLTSDRKGNILKLWSGEAFAERVDTSGATIDRFGMNIPTLKVTEEERVTTIERFKEVATVEVPEYKPVVNEMFVSLEGDVWMKIGNEDDRHWLVISNEGDPKMRINAPEDVDFIYAEGNRVYAILFEAASAAVYEWDFTAAPK